jgi:hypothetical protein
LAISWQWTIEQQWFLDQPMGASPRFGNCGGAETAG